MISLAIADVIQVRIVSILQQQIGINVLTYVCTATTGASKTYGDAALRVSSLINAAFKALISSAATYRGIGVRKIFPNPKSIEYPDVSLTGVGTSGPNPLPKQTCGMIRKSTDRPGVQGRGRLYIPFPSTADNSTTPVPIPTYVTRLNTLGAALSVPIVVGTAPDTATLKPVIWDRAHFQSTDVSSMPGQLFWGTQRRRGDYGKANYSPF